MNPPGGVPGHPQVPGGYAPNSLRAGRGRQRAHLRNDQAPSLVEQYPVLRGLEPATRQAGPPRPNEASDVLHQAGVDARASTGCQYQWLFRRHPVAVRRSGRPSSEYTKR